jgi:hypothetical protein
MKKVYIKFDRGDDLSTVKVVGGPKGFRDKLLVALGSIEMAPQWGKESYVREVLGVCRDILSRMKVEAFQIQYFYNHSFWSEKVVINREEF